MGWLKYEGTRHGYIYALTELNGCIRYIGKTVLTPDKRREQHINEAKSGKVTHKNNWIRILLSTDQEPSVVVLEEGAYTCNELAQREKHWISLLKSDKLTNATVGGDGGYNEGLHKWNTRVWTDYERTALSDTIREWHKERAERGLTCKGTDASQAERMKSWAEWLNNGGRKELSEKMKVAWNDLEKRKTWMTAITSDEVTRKKSEAMIARYKDPAERVRTGRAVSAGMTDESKRRIGEAVRLRHGYTEPISCINCAVCKIEFLPDRRSRRTCSTACRRVLSSWTRKANNKNKEKKHG